MSEKSEKNDRYLWLMAGSMLGMMGVYAGQSMMHGAHNSGKGLRKVAGKASQTARQAGEFLSALGESLSEGLH